MQPAAVTLLVACLTVAPAQAQMLTDIQLSGIYASGQASISEDILADGSSAVYQRNIDAIGSTDTTVNNCEVNSNNNARVDNVGDSALAFQENMGALSGMGSAEMRGNSATSRNTARVDNLAVAPASGLADVVSDASVGVASGSYTGGAGISAVQSAGYYQGNIKAMASGGTMRSNHIQSNNNGRVDNTGDSAVALQGNISAMSGLGAGQSRGNGIISSNRSKVDNTASSSGSVEVSLEGSTVYGNEAEGGSGEFSASQSAVSAQSNISALTYAGTVRGDRIRNTNFTDMANSGDSAVAMQSNIGTIAGLGSGVNTGNRVTNSNDARLDNIAASAGSAGGSPGGFASSGAGENSVLINIEATQSAVASQSNIAAITGAGELNSSRISNTNFASINQ